MKPQKCVFKKCIFKFFIPAKMRFTTTFRHCRCILSPPPLCVSQYCSLKSYSSAANATPPPPIPPDIQTPLALYPPTLPSLQSSISADTQRGVVQAAA